MPKPDEREHHASCKYTDLNLHWVCSQCGCEKDASEVERECAELRERLAAATKPVADGEVANVIRLLRDRYDQHTYATLLQRLARERDEFLERLKMERREKDEKRDAALAHAESYRNTANLLAERVAKAEADSAAKEATIAELREDVALFRGEWFELAARLCAIAVVGEIDKREVIRRESVMDFVVRGRQRIEDARRAEPKE